MCVLKNVMELKMNLKFSYLRHVLIKSNHQQEVQGVQGQGQAQGAAQGVARSDIGTAVPFRPNPAVSATQVPFVAEAGRPMFIQPIQPAGSNQVISHPGRNF